MCFNCILFTVPIPNVSMTALNHQHIGNTLSLRCDVRIVKGITSTVDIVWKADGREIQRYNGNMSENKTFYVYYFNGTTILTAYDNNTVYQCQVVVNRSPLINATDSLTLNLTIGEHKRGIIKLII